jgi:cytoskeletal protein RodZ
VAPQEIGAVLRAERVRRGLSLQDVARETKISERMLAAMEAGKFDQLPGAVFAKNFVRQYAGLLDIDAAPLLESLPRVDVASSPMPVPRQAAIRESRWDPRWNSALASIAWTVLAGSAAVAAYIHFTRGSPPRLVAVKTQEQRAPRPSQPQAAAPTEPLSSPPPATPAPSQKTSTPENGLKPVRVEITARDEAWIQITADDKNVFTGILKPSESKVFDADKAIRLLAGNAGGIEVTLNGRKLDALGPAGQVRTVRLTAEGPQMIPKTPPAPSTNPI